MMELDITRFVAEVDPYNFSASAAELGQNAGRITWSNAKQEAIDSPLLTTPDQIEAVREWFKGFGAWDDAERAAWSDADVNALVIQFISGDLRELENLCSDESGCIDWQHAETLAAAGTIGGHIYRGDEGRIYFCLGD